MLTDLRTLEFITYRGALALHFSDVATGQPITDGLDVRAWRYHTAEPRPLQRVIIASRSKQSGIFGFPALPGLESYQIGAAVAPGSVDYLVRIVDKNGRFLPQTRHFALPDATPQAQEISLFSAPGRPAPPGYAAVSGELLRTSTPGSPPEVTPISVAAWAGVTVTRPGANPIDPVLSFRGNADDRGRFVVMIPYPLIEDDVLLNEAVWTLAIDVIYDPVAIAADQTLLEQLFPTAERSARIPFQSTIDAQSPAFIFDTVAVDSADAQLFTVIGPVNATETNPALRYGKPLVVRSTIDANDATLSALLIQPA